MSIESHRNVLSLPLRLIAYHLRHETETAKTVKTSTGPIVLKKETNWHVGKISVQHKFFDSDGNHLFFRSGAISLVAAARGSVPQRLKRNLHPLFNLLI